MKSANNKYKFTIAKDEAGHMMLSAFCGEIDPAAVRNGKLVSPEEFAQALVEMIDRAKE